MQRKQNWEHKMINRKGRKKIIFTGKELKEGQINLGIYEH